MERKSTIAACATPRGASALAVIRISGPETFNIVKNCLQKKENFETAEKRTVFLHRFFGKTGKLIDHVSIIKYCAPSSYTGEDMVEIICHGSTPIIEAVCEAILDAGAEYARPGEFTRRAFLNGKMNLLKAEAVGAIARSRTGKQSRIAVANYLGEYSHIINNWKKDLEEIYKQIQAKIEFDEEQDDEGFIGGKIMYEKLKKLYDEIKNQLEKKVKGKQGITIAIVGLPNVGKSSLMNLILGYERAIVFPEEGTTRDAVSEWVWWQDHDVRFVDSAGIRKIDKGVEALGIQRSWEFVDCAEIALLVVSAERGIEKEDADILERRKNQKTLIIINKIDLAPGKEKENYYKTLGYDVLTLCAKEQKYRDIAVDFISKEINKICDQSDEESIVFSKRQEMILGKVQKELSQLIDNKEDTEDVQAQIIMEILNLIKGYSGENTSEELLNSIFDDFCIGK